ncbi:MAG: tRNA (cytidine(34)-2'-O)-methyltransferase [Tissierellia bacterium]|nr:tRNA (cytidine(34)-2'-O)-methyltransferase [Tissierellia bacterium]
MSLNIVLVEPEIPFNTGAIARSCGLTHSTLHLVKPLGFSVEEKAVKRAGLDYWDLVDIKFYENIDELLEHLRDKRFFLATTKCKNKYSDVEYNDGDYILFGKETKGLPKELLEENPDNCIRIPMLKDFGRSLNLSNACNIIMFEALRQLDFIDLE